MNNEPEQVMLATIMFVLKLEIRTRQSKRIEAWTNLATFSKERPCPRELDPMVLEYRNEHEFGVTRKRFTFELEAWKPETIQAFYKLRSFTQSDWFYEHLYEFGYTKDPVLTELFQQ